MIFMISVIFIYFAFFVETASAGTEKEIIIAADNKTSFESTEDTFLALTKILAKNEISAETDFNTVIQNNPSIKEILPKDMLTKKGFESKEILHNAIAFLTKDLICFSRDISPDEKIKVFMSESALYSYIDAKIGKPNLNFIAIFKENGRWFFYKHGKTPEVASEATSYFLNDPSFASYLEFVENASY